MREPEPGEDRFEDLAELRDERGQVLEERDRRLQDGDPGAEQHDQRDHAGDQVCERDRRPRPLNGMWRCSNETNGSST